MDIEWGKDGETGKIYILQARPETVQSRAGRTVQRFALKRQVEGARERPLASASASAPVPRASFATSRK